MNKIKTLGDFIHFHLMGIKGVAMTSLAQILVEMDKEVSGTDVEEDFVTADILNNLPVEINYDFENGLPEEAECLIYTSAHGGPANPQVVMAQKQGLAVFSHAEALGQIFNDKKGVAVCGVGGKSSVSAMITWIVEKLSSFTQDQFLQQSFSVGVGNIPGINKTGQWSNQGDFFIAEADEYVTDPAAPSKGEEITPRFSYLNPAITVCTNLQFDHPDVYRDFNHTKQVYGRFFEQIKNGGSLVINGDDENLKELAQKTTQQRSDLQLVTFGESKNNDFQLITYDSSEGEIVAQCRHQSSPFELKLRIPGKYNLMNALSAVAACYQMGIPVESSAKALFSFRSTMRRFELIGEKVVNNQSLKFYDDYAHHPREIKAVLQAFKEWYPQKRKIVCFQSHTFSRTRELFDQFVESFGDADMVLMIDIFPSARENFDLEMTSDLLCEAINSQQPQLQAQNLKTIERLADFLQKELTADDVVLTVGAGDIYKVHDLIK